MQMLTRRHSYDYCSSERSEAESTQYSDESAIENGASNRVNRKKERRYQRKSRVTNVLWTLATVFTVFPVLFLAVFGVIFQINPDAAKTALGMISDVFRSHSNATDVDDMPSMHPSVFIDERKYSPMPTLGRETQSPLPINSPAYLPLRTEFEPSVMMKNPSRMYSVSANPSEQISTRPSTSPSISASVAPSKESEKEMKIIEWVQIAAIMGPNNDDFTGWGVSLSEDGNCMAIGSPNKNINGYVRVFEKNGSGAWQQHGRTLNGTNIQTVSGKSVDISDDCNTLAVGSTPIYNSGFDSPGSISMYRIVDEEWHQSGNDIIGDLRFDETGESVILSADGNRIIVPVSGFLGRVRVFDVSDIDGNFVQVGHDIDGDTSRGRFGVSIALSGPVANIVAVGSEMGDTSGPGEDTSKNGYVKVLELSQGQWTQLGNTIDGIQPEDLCGQSVSLSYDGHILAVGSPRYVDGSKLRAGLVRVFRYEDGSWLQMGENIVGMTENAYFGSSTSFSNTNGEVLAIRILGIEGYAGQVFEFVNEQWQQVGNTLSNTLPADMIGAVSIRLSSDGTVLVASDPSFDDRSGIVSIYEHAALSYPSGAPSVEPTLSSVPSQVNSTGQSISSIPSIISYFSPSVVPSASPSEQISTRPSTSPSISASVAPSKESEKEMKIIEWVQVAAIMGPNNDDFTGWEISLSEDGNCMAIGSPNKNINGYVRVFKKNGSGAWQQHGRTLNGTNIQTVSGKSVDISDDCNTLAVGSTPIYNSGSSGSISMYRIVDEEWHQSGNDLIGDDGADIMGESVILSADGNRIIVPQPYNKIIFGRVRVFDVSDIDGNFVQVGKGIYGKHSILGQKGFGIGIALSGPIANIVAVGGEIGTSSGFYGYVKVLELSQGQWTQLGNTIDGIQPEDLCGQSVSLSYDGHILAVGSPRYADGSKLRAGLVRVFRYEDGSWLQMGENIVGMNENAYFGSSTSLSSNGEVLAILGIEGYAGQVFEFVNEQWQQVGNSLHGNMVTAIRLSGDGTVLVASDPSFDDRSGIVRIYELAALSYPSAAPSTSRPTNWPSAAPSSSIAPSDKPSSQYDKEFEIRSIYDQYDPTNEWCLTAQDKSQGSFVFVRACQSYSERKENLQLWKRSASGQVVLAGPAIGYCFKSMSMGLSLEFCNESDEYIFTVVDTEGKMKHTKSGNSFLVGIDTSNKFSRVRLYNDLSPNESLSQWRISYLE